jgi:lipopolysaccharide export system permease protein
METVWKYINDLVGKGLGFKVIAEFLYYSAIHIIPLALPLAILLSTIMTFGNLGERYELVAVKAAGISLIKAMRPLFVFSIFLSLGAFYVANNVIPKVNLNWGALMYDIMSKKPGVNIVENVFYTGIDGYAIKVGKKHQDKATLEDVLIYADNKQQGTMASPTIIMAKYGKMYTTPDDKFMLFELFEGKRYNEMTEDADYYKTYPHNVLQFETYKMKFDLSDMQFTRSDKDLFKEDYRMLNIRQLRIKEDSLKKELEKTKNNMVKYISPYYQLAPDSLVVDSWSLDSRKEFLKQKKSKNITLDTLKSETVSVHNQDTTHKDSTKKPNETVAKTYQGKNNEMPEEASVETIDLDPGYPQEPIEQKSVTRVINNNKNVRNILSSSATDLKYARKTLSRYIAEKHKKFTLAFSCIILFFVGAPLGAMIRKGGFGLPFVVSILIFIIYFVINVVGEKMIRDETLSPFIGMWLSSFIFFPIAILLTYKASTDSPIFDMEAYQKFLKRIKSIFVKPKSVTVK